MPKMPEFGIPCIVPRLVQAGGDGEEKQSPLTKLLSETEF